MQDQMKWPNKFTTIIRQGNFIEWLEDDPILLDRELICVYGIDEDAPWFKIGDGKSRFSELNYITQISELLPYFDCFVRISNNRPTKCSRFILDPRGINEEE